MIAVEGCFLKCTLDVLVLIQTAGAAAAAASGLAGWFSQRRRPCLASDCHRRRGDELLVLCRSTMRTYDILRYFFDLVVHVVRRSAITATIVKNRHKADLRLVNRWWLRCHSRFPVDVMQEAPKRFTGMAHQRAGLNVPDSQASNNQNLTYLRSERRTNCNIPSCL
jgi:hypothetical protein